LGSPDRADTKQVAGRRVERDVRLGRGFARITGVEAADHSGQAGEVVDLDQFGCRGGVGITDRPGVS
jgi:hypothetical protein